jgi:hypothetical protein
MALRVFVKLVKGIVVMEFCKAEFWMGFEQCLCRYCFFHEPVGKGIERELII